MKKVLLSVMVFAFLSPVMAEEMKKMDGQMATPPAAAAPAAKKPMKKMAKKKAMKKDAAAPAAAPMGGEMKK